MTKLIIGNQLTEETVEGDNALPDDYRAILGRVSHRLIWLAEEGDVIVLPSAPDPDFAAQVWRILGIAERPPAVLVPPTGEQGTALLYDDRYRDPGLLADLRHRVDAHGVDRILPFYFDEAVVRLAADLGLTGAAPAFRFLAESGNELVNCKSFFRTLAAGIGVPVADGRAVRTVAAAEDYITELLETGRSAIVKQDVHGGGFGNEIYTGTEGLNGIGANRTLAVDGRAAVAEHLAASWHRYSQDGRHRVVIEHYIHDCIPIYAEIDVTDDGIAIVGHGEVRMKPVNNGLVVPAPSAALPRFDDFLGDATRVGETVRVLGYRGRMSIDAIVTPGEDILLTEFNGRVGGSTHLHLIGERLVGPDYLRERVLIGRNRCGWNSVGEALGTLRDRGLAYDVTDRAGVLIAGDDGQCLMVGKSLDHALELERAMITELGVDPDA
ncbi:preATP grasp domain-containing protein [Catenuloplanes atrovinosus]|uniref:ATP-grasp domain-containing protein n=1 Tax=Catenuloplanes atrovinosus TaxID=137266 RepID=A0AAE3YJG7_9ACTN|nr:peptide ligase PGM1-related protein [Catenuloplanes atrovinosus]MDR7273617.1 hypothetical protein [Catenuloplanes atrovinosus]